MSGDMDLPIEQPSMPIVERLVASYPDYVEAQRAVDALSDAGFPVQHLRIVGRDLRLVEDVTGRLTIGRAALAGAGTGAWLGLLVGLLVGLFTTGPAWFGLIIGGIVIGAIWGAIFGAVAHWATAGRRDFSSTRGLVAGQYDVEAEGSWATQARTELARVTATTVPRSPSTR